MSPVAASVRHARIPFSPCGDVRAVCSRDGSLGGAEFNSQMLDCPVSRLVLSHAAIPSRSISRCNGNTEYRPASHSVVHDRSLEGVIQLDGTHWGGRRLAPDHFLRPENVLAVPLSARRATAGQIREPFPPSESSPARTTPVASSASGLVVPAVVECHSSRNLASNFRQAADKPCRAASSPISCRVTLPDSSSDRIRVKSFARPTLRAMTAR